MSHVVLLLESNVDDSLRYLLAYSIQEFGFSDDNLKLWGKVNLVGGVLSLWVNVSLQDVVLQKLNGSVSVVLVPFIEDFLFVLGIQLLS